MISSAGTNRGLFVQALSSLLNVPQLYSSYKLIALGNASWESLLQSVHQRCVLAAWMNSVQCKPGAHGCGSVSRGARRTAPVAWANATKKVAAHTTSQQRYTAWLHRVGCVYSFSPSLCVSSIPWDMNTALRTTGNRISIMLKKNHYNKPEKKNYNTVYLSVLHYGRPVTILTESKQRHFQFRGHTSHS